MNLCFALKRWAGFAFAVLFLLAAFQAKGQTSNGTLVGTVTDASGAVVPNATVKAVSAQLNVSREITTGPNGTYHMDSLQPGVYTVTISASGFQLRTVENVVLSPSVSTTVDAKLQVGAATSTVTVEATAGQAIDTQSGQLGESLGNEQTANLPYASLNPAELAMTLPGVQDSNGRGISNGVDFSVNGTRPRANNFLIDGQDDNDYAISGQAYQPSNVGAIQNFTVLTNSYGAEYGRGGGSVSNYNFKSGTNTFHGQAWEIANNSEFAATNAATAFGGGTKPVSVENQFGFDVGGPIKHNSLFFFGSVQWDRLRSTANGDTLDIPDSAGIATLNSLLPNSNVSLLLASLGGLQSTGLVQPPGGAAANCIALGPDPATGVDRGCVQLGLFERSGVDEIQNDRQMYYRADWHMGPSDTLTGAYIRDDFSLTPDFFNNSGALPPFDTEQGGPSQLFWGTWTHVISDTRVNEMRFSYTNIGFTFGPTPATAANPLFNTPQISFDASGALPSLGVGSGFPQGREHKTWQAQDAMSITTGKHTIKGGIDLTFLSVVDQIPFNSRGTIGFTKSPATATTAAYTSLGNFVDDFSGQSGPISKVFGNPTLRPSVTMYMPYVEDTWRVKDNLSLDLGLRYEYWGTVENTLDFPALQPGLGFGVVGATFPNMYSAEQKPDENNFAPRVSFAYTPHIGSRFFGADKTVLRGGFGVFYDGLFTNILDNTGATPPNAQGGTIVGGAGRGQANAVETLAAVAPVASPTATVDTIAANLRSPMTLQWNLDVQRELPSNFVLTVAYVGTRGEHLFANQDFNGESNFARLNPNFGEIVVRDNGGDSDYHSGQVELERRFSNSFIMRNSYTYSKLLDDTSEVFTLEGLTSFSQNLECQKCDFGPSDYDRRHRFVSAYVWTLPYATRNGFLKALTDRYTWSGILTLESGIPATIQDGFDAIGTGHPGARPVVGSPSVRLSPNTVGIDGTEEGFTATPGTVFGPVAVCNGAAAFDPSTGLFIPPAGCTAQPTSAFSYFIPAPGVPGTVGRNSIYGPGQFFLDMNVQRIFPLPFGRGERQTLTFRAEAFNVLNHPNLFTPNLDMLSTTFDETAPTIAGGRTMKFWLMYSF